MSMTTVILLRGGHRVVVPASDPAEVAELLDGVRDARDSGSSARELLRLVKDVEEGATYIDPDQVVAVLPLLDAVEAEGHFRGGPAERG